MLIFAIDDEPKMLRLLHKAIAEAEPGADIRDYEDDTAPLDAIKEQGLKPDVVFSDIELRGVNGLELAVKIKNAVPETKIIFVTGYPNYAADAFRLHVNGYIVKPADAERVREELDALDLPRKSAEPNKLQVRCFGVFDVFFHGEPLIFARTRTKELLAYLVDREGAACTSGEIALALWEGDGDDLAMKNRVRVLINDLRTTLRGIGMEDALIRERRHLAIRRDALDCDYYRMLDGDSAAVNAYQGEYMKQYSWAELTAGRLQFRR